MFFTISLYKYDVFFKKYKTLRYNLVLKEKNKDVLSGQILKNLTT